LLGGGERDIDPRLDWFLVNCCPIFPNEVVSKLGGDSIIKWRKLATQ